MYWRMFKEKDSKKLTSYLVSANMKNNWIKKSYEGKSSRYGTGRERNIWWKFLMESDGENHS